MKTGQEVLALLQAMTPEQLALPVVMDPGLTGVESTIDNIALSSDMEEVEEGEEPEDPRIVIYGYDN